MDPRQDAGVIDEETSTESSAPPVVLELQGEIVPSPLDLDEDPTEWILAERLCPRVRVGDYRVLYQVDALAQTVLILAVGHRRDVYR